MVKEVEQISVSMHSWPCIVLVKSPGPQSKEWSINKVRKYTLTLPGAWGGAECRGQREHRPSSRQPWSLNWNAMQALTGLHYSWKDKPKNMPQDKWRSEQLFVSAWIPVEGHKPLRNFVITELQIIWVLKIHDLGVEMNKKIAPVWYLWQKPKQKFPGRTQAFPFIATEP